DTAITQAAFTGTGAQLNGFERTAITNVTVATFTHGNGIEPVTGFTVTIDWGDATTSPGVLTLDPTSHVYTVKGTHTFLDEHPKPIIAGRQFTITVTVTDDTGNAADTHTITGSADIKEE